MFKLLHRFIIQLLSFHLHDVAPSFPWCGRLLSPAEIGWRPKGTVGKNHRPLQNLLMLRSPDFSVETSVETWFPKKTFSWSWNIFLTIPGFQKKSTNLQNQNWQERIRSEVSLRTRTASNKSQAWTRTWHTFWGPDFTRKNRSPNLKILRILHRIQQLL